VAPRAAPAPVPAGRGLWRLTVHQRRWSTGDNINNTMIAELPNARGRRLDRNWNQPAQLTFALDSYQPEAALVTELQTEVVAWRWREDTAQDWPVFAGPVTQAEDQLGADSGVVTFTCHDYLAQLTRRLYTAATPWTMTGIEQDQIVRNLVNYAKAPLDATGASLLPGGYLPIQVTATNPNGTSRGNSGVTRDRTYPGGSIIGQLLDELAKVQNGFDYDIFPLSATNAGDIIHVYYPYQGIARAAPVLMYGSTVNALTRSVNSADYGNYYRVLGNNGSADPAAAQLYGEAYNADATDVAVGLWQSLDNAADVSLGQTLTDQAQGDLALGGVLVPSYNLTLTPGVWTYGTFWVGDTLSLIVQSGRLAVNTAVRLLSLSWVIGDDGAENIEVTVGRPSVTLANLLRANNHDVNALTRR
jgi:hypothetical protein